MGATVSVIKTLIIPALVALIVFIVSTQVLVPLWKRYRNRYGQYLPLETISNQTLSVRARMQNAVSRLLAPSAWRVRVSHRLVAGDRGSFDSEEGEELGEVDESAARRVSGHPRNHHTIGSPRRLSRDLEEGFMDDSEEEAESARGR
ncbi:hypothetical protein VTK56DRAFT_7384 [Thermocarpiscus australiensis]